MLDLLNLKSETFGLDISDPSIKVAAIKRKKGTLKLISFGTKTLLPGIVEDGLIKDEGSLASAIKETVAEVKGQSIKTKYVVCSLPEEGSFLQIIQMPSMEEEKMQKAILFEAENYIPFSLNEVYLDSQKIVRDYDGQNTIDVLLAAVPKKVVDPYVSCLKKAGFIPWAFEIESQAITRALIGRGFSSFPVLLVDLGARKTGFVVFSGHSLRSTFSIPVSAGRFTEAISDFLQVSKGEAEELKIKYGINIGRSIEARKVFEAVAPLLDELVDQIKKYLSYYKTHIFKKFPCPGGESVRKIYVCGGGANLTGLNEFLSERLKITVEAGDPLINIDRSYEKNRLDVLDDEAISYTTAFGLALREFQEKD